MTSFSEKQPWTKSNSCLWWTYLLEIYTGLLSQAPSLPRIPKQRRDNHQNSCNHMHINISQVLFITLPAWNTCFFLKTSSWILIHTYWHWLCNTDTHPIPHASQQLSRSSAEISKEVLPPLWMHNLSDIASAAPKACRKSKMMVLKFI